MAGALEGFRLSKQQERLWRLGAASQRCAYRLCFAVRVHGSVSPLVLQERMQRLARDFEVLRTRFVQPAGMLLPLQVIDESVTAIGGCERQESAASTAEECWRAWLEESAGMPLSTPSLLLRVASVRDDQQVLLGCTPAMCADAGSVETIVAALCAAESNAATNLTVQYADYAQWQEELEATEAGQQGRAFWSREEHRGLLELVLRDPYAATAERSFRPAQVDVPLPASTMADFNSAVARCGVSSAAFLLGCWQVLLSVLLDSRRVMVLAADRSLPAELQGAIGPFERYLPVTATIALDHALPDLLQGVQRKLTLAAECREHFDIDEALERAGRASAPFLFSLHASSGESASGAQLIAVSACNEPYDLKCAACLESGRLTMQLQYDGTQFGGAYAARLAAQLAELIRRAVAVPTAVVGALVRASASERAEQLAALARRQDADTEFHDLHEMFERQAVLTPDAAAVLFGQHRLSYRELNESANRLAALLRSHAVQAQDRVAICLARSPAAVIAILAVLKAGCAYVPLDPSYPRRRLELILTSSRARILITQSALLDSCSGFTGLTLCLDSESQALRTQPATNSCAGVRPQDLAYLIYTSGSTGTPKGVMATRAGAARSTLARFGHYSRPPERFLLLPSLAFDSSVAPLFWTLCSGGCLVLIDEQAAADPRRIAATIDELAVTHVLAVPSLYRQLLEVEHRSLRSLRTVIVAGEACPPTLVDRHVETMRAAQLHNEYGPTEATVWSSVWRCEPQTRPRDIVPIGKPVDGARLYVLGRDLQLLPAGAIGELYIGGAGIARGYYEQPGLTALRFVPDPYADEPGAVLYRTGDRVRLLGSGDLQFCGRVDQQVKVRGFRIECGEIEAVLERHAHVDSTAVTVSGSAEDSAEIVAYVVPKAGRPIDRAALRDHLSEHLPSYMVPHKFVTLGALPLGANGKVDYRNLPAPDESNSGARQYEAPVTPTERRVCEIWEAVLKRSPVGRRDNFFDLGGHSLLAVQIVNRVQHSFAVSLEIGQIFRFQSLAELAEHLDVLAGEPSLAAPADLDLQEVRV